MNNILNGAPQTSKSTFEKNIQGIRNISEFFLSFYNGLGYQKIDSVQVSTGVDPTVRFIGSHISVMKPWLVDKEIPEGGICMVQDCIRIKSINSYVDENFDPMYGSFFTSIGALDRPENLDRCVKNVLSFFNQLGISNDRIEINVSSKDEDLLQVANSLDINVNVDTKPETYYQHQIGVDGVSGRNFNFAIKSPSGNSLDVGNIIILENSEKKLAVETAIGTSTLLKQILGIGRIQEIYDFPGLEKINEKDRYKLQDLLFITIYLLREGLKPFGGDNRSRLLKSFIKNIIYFILNLKLDNEDLKEIVKSFEKKYFGEEKETDLLFNLMESFVNKIKVKKESQLSKEDKLIKSKL